MAAQVTIPQLPAAGALTGSELVPVVQNGQTVQTTTGAISGAGALNYPFLTVGSTVGLTQARQIAVGSGLSQTDNGAGASLQIDLIGAAQSLNSSPTGIQVKTGVSTVTGRSIAASAGLTVTDGDGVAGNPTIGLGTVLANFAALTGTGVLAMQAGLPAKVTIQGTANQITVTDGNGAADPTIGLATNPVLPGTGGVTLPSGTTAQRGSPVNGLLRYNSQLGIFEGYANGSWMTTMVGGVTSVNVSGGSTGLTTSGGPITTAGIITLAGTLNAASGGTGQSSYAVGDIIYASGATALSKLTLGTQGLVLKAGASAPEWGAVAGGTF